MRKKILVATFFAIIMLMLPCTSAFNMPLTKDDKNEINNLIDNQKQEINDALDDLINPDGSLNVDEVEKIYENYVLTGDSSVINSDPWEWITNRLGWIYITLENVINLYNQGIFIYNKIVSGAQAVQNFFDSIQDMRSAWQAFTANPLNFQNIKNLISSVIDLLEATINVFEFISSDALMQAVEEFVVEVQNFIDFLNSSPWTQPILVRGNIIGFDESLKITVKQDSVTSSDTYNLSFTTANENLPWFVHKVSIKGEYKDKQTVKDRYAFSMGIIDEDWQKGDFKVLSKERYPVLIELFKNLRYIIFRFFNKLNLNSVLPVKLPKISFQVK